MTMRKYLLLFLSLVFAVSISQAKTVTDSVYQIPKTKIAPTIDGVEDAVWKTLDWNLQRTYSVGDPPTPTDSGAGLTGMSKAMWDADNFYLLFYSVDDVIMEIPANATWNQDAIEFYIDGDNSKIADGVSPDPGGGLAPGDWQFTIMHHLIGNEATNHASAFGTTLDSTGVEFKIRDVSETEGFPGWMLEVKIPLANLGIDGAGITGSGLSIGWELQQDEADDATVGRKGMSKWWHYSNNSWTNAALWGNALMSTREVDSTLVIYKTNATIAVDGVMDPIYKLANPVTTNLFRVGDPPGTDAADTDPLSSFVTAYPLYDGNNYYVFFDVNDAVITNIPANANWNQDAVEFYVDTDNSKTKDGVSPDPGGGLSPGDYQATFSNLWKGTEVGRLGQAGLPTSLDTTGFEFKIVDKPEGGYYVELKMVWAGLGVDPAEGTEIGFEVQMDNSNDAATGRQGMQKWWHNSNNSWTDASLWGTAKLGPLVTLGVRQNKPSVVTEFALGQNYPNPFNPTTKIDYTIAKAGMVKLSVYNLLGKEVATLVNGVKQVGTYTAPFNAANLSSGVYFYKLQAGNTVLTNKMVLLK